MRQKTFYTCKQCGRISTKVDRNGMCLACRRYLLKEQGVVHELPPKGELRYDNEGKPICHICGRAFHRLGSHAYQAHTLYADEYRAMFALPPGQPIASEQSLETVRAQNEKNLQKAQQSSMLKRILSKLRI